MPCNEGYGYTLPVRGSVILLTRFYLRAAWRARRTPGKTLLVGRQGRWQVRQMDALPGEQP